MKEIELMKERHSVRSYLEKPVGPEERGRLSDVIAECNRLGGLNIQPVFDEPEAFGSFMAHYGKFSGVKNYVALIGRKGEDEKIGYYGEKIVLAAQEIGLNTCWVALTYKKSEPPSPSERTKALLRDSSGLRRDFGSPA